jgi:hypothetical protein
MRVVNPRRQRGVGRRRCSITVAAACRRPELLGKPPEHLRLRRQRVARRVDRVADEAEEAIRITPATMIRNTRSRATRPTTSRCTKARR